MPIVPASRMTRLAFGIGLVTALFVGAILSGGMIVSLRSVGPSTRIPLMPGSSHSSTSSSFILLANSALPVLGVKFGNYVSGFGVTRPSTVRYGGDGYSSVSTIVWKKWGSGRATGTGIGWYVPSGASSGEGLRKRTEVLAYGRGRCGSVFAYTQFSFWFPTEKQTFNPHFFIDTCSGVWNYPYRFQVGVSTAPCNGEAFAQVLRSRATESGNVISWACIGNYAATEESLSYYGTTTSFEARGPNWVGVSGGNILPRSGLPPSIYPRLKLLLSEAPQTSRFPF